MPTNAGATSSTFTEEGALLAETFGLRLLRYVTSADDRSILRHLSGESALESRAEANLVPLTTLARHAAAAASGPNAAPVRMQLGFLGQHQVALGTSLGTALRREAGGRVELGVPDDPVSRALLLMLRDVFPLFLLPPDPWFPGMVNFSAALYSHPERGTFEAAVEADPDLAPLFGTAGSATSDPLPFVFRSTGAGASLQVELLPDLLLGAAWARAQARDQEDMTTVGDEVIAVVDLVRRVGRGQPSQVPVQVAFTGLLPDADVRVEMPFGVLRPIAAHERAFAPPSIDGGLSTTLAGGETIQISYAGDLVLDTAVDYRLRVTKPPDFETPPRWPEDISRPMGELQANIDTIRLAALVAGTGSEPLMLIPTWRRTLDPLNFGPILSWTDARTVPGLSPRRLSQPVADEIGGLARAISNLRRPYFDVAVRRTISGITGRGDAGDALIDLVVGWENLFGSRDELKFRITASIAWVLGGNAVERSRLQAEAARIYDRRSEILHGAAPAANKVQASLSSAREITIRLLRTLFLEKPEVLAVANGSDRSRAVILGESLPPTETANHVSDTD